MTKTIRRQAEPFGPWYDRFRAATVCQSSGCRKPICEASGGWKCHDCWKMTLEDQQWDWENECIAAAYGQETE